MCSIKPAFPRIYGLLKRCCAGKRKIINLLIPTIYFSPGIQESKYHRSMYVINNHIPPQTCKFIWISFQILQTKYSKFQFSQGRFYPKISTFHYQTPVKCCFSTHVISCKNFWEPFRVYVHSDINQNHTLQLEMCAYTCHSWTQVNHQKLSTKG